MTAQRALAPATSAWSYIEVLKPRETSLLTFIGLFAAVVAGKGHPPVTVLLLVFVTLLLGSAGVNGLTNYLDREVDARMSRTCGRSLPSGRIRPPEKALPLLIALVPIGFVMAWFLHPWAFAAGLAGTVAALVFRKTGFTHLLGSVSGCAPVAVGWFAVDPAFSWAIVFLCILIAVWIPLHVWSVMLAHRDDYLGAGVSIFPLTWRSVTAVRTLLMLSLVLYAASIALYLMGGFGLVYLVVANVLGITMVVATFRLSLAPTSHSAWLVYKLSAFPYLGLLFLFMGIDLWLR
ncbi:MAG: UbiA family prenyltransferase [Chloroflexota bacterium]